MACLASARLKVEEHCGYNCRRTQGLAAFRVKGKMGSFCQYAFQRSAITVSYQLRHKRTNCQRTRRRSSLAYNTTCAPKPHIHTERTVSARYPRTR